MAARGRLSFLFEAEERSIVGTGHTSLSHPC